MQLFGTSGIRRISDASLIQLALKVGLSVGKDYGSVVVGSDTRTSSDAIKHALISGLLAASCRGYDAGVIPTPTLALAARGFDAGAMITASHNPPQYNGIKLLNPDGSAFGAYQQQRIEELILAGSLPAARWDEIKGSSAYEGAVGRHVERIMRDFPGGLGVKVVVDGGGGAACGVTPLLLEKLGCEVVVINGDPGGFFPRDIEPTEANLGDLMRTVSEVGADLGIAHDGDGDRMVVVDDRGRFVSGDKLLAIFAREAGAREVVTTVDASMVIDEMGFMVTRTRVGDTSVSEELKKGGDFGGEPSGSWVFSAVSLCPDGIYAAAVATYIASNQRLSPLVDGIPDYPILRDSVHSSEVAMSRLERHLMAMEPLSVNTVDGIKLGFADGWLLVRKSGTEPKVRITAEAKSQERVQQLFDSGVAAVNKSMEKGGG